MSNASELISSIAEKYNNDPAGLKNYVDYIAKCPRAERSEQRHGLWAGSDEIISLSRATEEVANHEGIVWTHVVSLRREDADRLGYDNADAWRKLVKSKIPVIAKSMNIPVDKLKWYGAFHNEGNHPHIHMIVYSEDKKKGYLNNKGIEAMRQAFGTALFHDDLLHVYEQKDEVRKALKENTEKKIKEIAAKLRQEEKQSPVVASLLLELSKALKQTKGKKQYGWLKALGAFQSPDMSDGCINFPHFGGTLSADRIKTYVQLSESIHNFVTTHKRVSPRVNEPPNDKYVFRTWLIRLGMIGDEYKTARVVLTEKLEGNSAWLHRETANCYQEHRNNELQEENSAINLYNDARSEITQIESIEANESKEQIIEQEDGQKMQL